MKKIDLRNSKNYFLLSPSMHIVEKMAKNTLKILRCEDFNPLMHNVPKRSDTLAANAALKNALKG